MKIHIAGIATETNTFAMAPTGLSAWEVDHGEGRTAEAQRWHEAGLRLAARDGHEVHFGLLAAAQPAGTTVQAVYETLRDQLLERLQADLPVNAVLLVLHGAMVAEACADCEGDLIEHVRALVGPAVPIGVELDLHCHFTERMRRHADTLIAYKEYPHTDIVERFEELWALTIATAQGRVRPSTAVHDCRMVGFWHTTREPMKSFVARMKALEARPGVLSVSFGHGFPWGDVPEAGAKVWVVTDSDEALGAQLARELGQEIWDMRHQTAARQSSIDQAMGRLASHEGDHPLVLADIADNAGGGAGSDATFILRALVQRGIGQVALAPFWDLGAIQMCCEAGVGAKLDLRVGGKLGPLSGDPVDLHVTVRAIVPDHWQSGLGGHPSPCGRSVWVSTQEGLDLVLVSIRQQAFGTELFTGLGINLSAQRAIVVKSSQHFHAAFAPLASEVLYVETPGLLRTDFAGIPYRHRSLNYWPRVELPREAAITQPGTGM
ncbi:MAG: M81 family metallopeptidase [Betaproteobacteria bacterium]|jgi:microcystin degradation protein MlrC